MPVYPGLGLPLRHFPQGEYGTYPMGMHGNCWGGGSELLPVREVAMMNIMDRLTDKLEWEKKVFDEEIVAKWRKEALELPDKSLWKQATGGKMHSRWNNSGNHEDDFGTRKIKQLTNIMSNEAFDYCVKELRSKAKYYLRSKLIPTLDACATVVKSDTLISSELQQKLRNAFDKLKADQIASPDWHPKSNEMVQDLIHPSMYPLVYGRSRVFQEEVVGVEDTIEKWSGKGEIIANIGNDGLPNSWDRYGGVGGRYPPRNFWSDVYQWLPSNVSFQGDGSVKFTSYVNNLHPDKHPDIYRTIELFIQAALPAWDQCLALMVDSQHRLGAGRTTSRFPKPDNPDDENPDNWDPSGYEETEEKDPASAMSESNESPNAEVDVEQTSDEGEDEEEYLDDNGNGYDNRAERDWHNIRKPVQPKIGGFDPKDEFYAAEETLRLSQVFKDRGLQIIVKMASIELTPEKPDFPAGGWHVEGQMNEKICATALYYLDSENITTNDLSFRMQTSAYMNDDWEVGQDSYHWMQQIYGTGLGGGISPCLQNYGSVETKEGRLLAFPNVFQHRVSPFRLIDPTKPGHRRFIALWLVDPHTRIISTANVPPQQLNWWSESIFSGDRLNMSKFPAELAKVLQDKGVDITATTGKLPPELNDMLKAILGDDEALLMSEREAKEHRAKLMAERTNFQGEAETYYAYVFERLLQELTYYYEKFESQ